MARSNLVQTMSSYDIIYQKDFYEIMSNSNDYNNGYWFGKDSGYREGYEEGVQAERNRIKRAVEGDSGLPASEASTLGAMVGGSIILTIFGWCFVGVIIFLFWIGGNSGEWWFPWIWRIAFWGGIGFMAVMNVLGIVMTIAEHQETKHSSEMPVDDPNMPWYKKYPPADVIQTQKKK